VDNFSSEGQAEDDVAVCYACFVTTIPTRFEAGLFEAARLRGVQASRSAAQQLAHWARIGRAMETAPGVDQRAVESVLTGEMPYDNAEQKEQAMIRAEWDQRIAARLSTLDLSDLLDESPGGWVEADQRGNLIDHRRKPVAV
jgi:hypothetical protein